MSSRFYKNNEGDRVWWLDDGVIGDFIFSFDKEKTYNLFEDYPQKLDVREWIIFNNENEYWEEFFKDRNEKYEAEHAEEIYRLLNG